MPQRAQHRLDRGVVGQLAAARREHDEQRAFAAGAHDMLQQVGRSLVAPLDVVEHQQRGVLQHAFGHGGEQLLARHDRICVCAERRQCAERFDPRAVGVTAVGLE